MCIEEQDNPVHPLSEPLKDLAEVIPCGEGRGRSVRMTAAGNVLAGGSEPPGSPAAARESALSSSWRKGRTHDMKTVSNGALWAGCIELTLGMLGVLAWAVPGDTVVTLTRQCLLPYL